MQNNFCKNLNLLFSKHAARLRYVEDEENKSFIIDDNENKINVFPIPLYEERFLSPNNSESYTYLSICRNGHYTEVIRIKSCALFNPSMFISQFGNKPFASFNDSSWTIFFKTIKVILQEIEQKKVYQYSGWDKELDKYIFGNLLIDANSISHIQTALVKTDTLLSEKTNIDICKNVNNIAHHISNKKIIGHIFIIYLLMGHINQRFVQVYHISPEFVLSILAKTNSYKTATAIAIFNTYNGPVSSFEDSLASVRKMFQSNKSGITIVDDYKSSTYSNDEKYEKIVRLSGDAQTTGKYVAGNKVVDEQITGMSVITGEIRPHLQQSSYARILFVDLEKSPINLNYLTQLQNSKADINSFIVLFVKYILNKDDFDSTCIALFKKHRDELLNDDNYKGMYGRYYSMYGWFAAVWDIYEMLLKHYDVSIDFDFKSELKAYIYAQYCMYDNNPVKLFKIGYTELLNSNELVVLESSEINDLDFDVIDYSDKLFLKSGMLYKKICKFWKDKGIDFPCSERKLRQYLYEAGILEVRNGKYTVEKKTKNKRSYSGCYLFKNIFINYGGTKDEEF